MAISHNRRGESLARVDTTSTWAIQLSETQIVGCVTLSLGKRFYRIGAKWRRLGMFSYTKKAFDANI